MADKDAESDKLRELKTPATRQLLNLTKALLDQANAEITQLRAELDNGDATLGSYVLENQKLCAELRRLRTALEQTKQTLIDVQCYATKREGRLRAVLEKARPYVEHCADGSAAATAALREIDALTVGSMRPGTVHE